MEQIIYEQAFKEHCVTSNNKMKGKKHLKWVALFRRHASSSKAMSLRKTVNFFLFPGPCQNNYWWLQSQGNRRWERTLTPTVWLVGTKQKLQSRMRSWGSACRCYTLKHCLVGTPMAREQSAPASPSASQPPPAWSIIFFSIKYILELATADKHYQSLCCSRHLVEQLWVIKISWMVFCWLVWSWLYSIWTKFHWKFLGGALPCQWRDALSLPDVCNRQF